MQRQLQVIGSKLALICIGSLCGQIGFEQDVLAEAISVRETSVTLRHIDYQFALKEDESGLRTMDWSRFKTRPKSIVQRHVDGIYIDNGTLRVTLIPSMARVHSLINVATGNELLWINPCAVPLGANNDTGVWMTWGGIERVLPRKEHGTTHLLDWDFKVLCNRSDQASVLCWVTEPLTGLRVELTYSLYADQKYLETIVVVRNPTSNAQKYSHWTTATLSPGPKNEVTARTELVIPADRFIPDERDFNDWMPPLIGTSASSSPLRMVGNWKSIGDLMTSPLNHAYYAVYCNESQEGIVHTFDLQETPTVDIWGWGFPATAKRQQEFTAEPGNAGYIEVWNGNVPDFKDESLAALEPGGMRTWCERTFAVHGISEANLRREIGNLVGDMAPDSIESDHATTFDIGKPSITRSIVARGNDQYDWFQTRAVWLPKPFGFSKLLVQQKTHDGSHGYYDIFESNSVDGSQWTVPSRIPSMSRSKQADGYEVVAGDLWPTYHSLTQSVIATGKTFNFREGTEEDILREKVSYAIFEPSSKKQADAEAETAGGQWSVMKTLQMPRHDKHGRPIIAPNAGCNQPLVIDSGHLFLPIRYQTSNSWRNYVTMVAECSFDGETLRYLKHGTEHSHPVGRGLYEPSIVQYQSEFFLTLRADHDGFVSKSSNGLDFQEAVRWRFDDGEPLGSYNTQQHWVVGGGRLYLVYTRRGADNGHIMRHRAPLFIAQVDPESLRVIRATEQVLVPEAGRALGNSGVCRINDKESWVVVGEGAPAKGRTWTGNQVILAKLCWR